MGGESRGRRPAQAKNGGTKTHPLDINMVKVAEREEREGIVLWRRPVTTLHYCARELLIELVRLLRK